MKDNHADGFNEYRESVFPLVRHKDEVHLNGQEGIRGAGKTGDTQD